MHLWLDGGCRGVNASGLKFNVATTTGTVVNRGDKARDMKVPEVVKDMPTPSIVLWMKRHRASHPQHEQGHGGIDRSEPRCHRYECLLLGDSNCRRDSEGFIFGFFLLCRCGCGCRIAMGTSEIDRSGRDGMNRGSGTCHCQASESTEVGGDSGGVRSEWKKL